MKSAVEWEKIFTDSFIKHDRATAPRPITVLELVEAVQADVKATIYKELYLENERKSRLVIGNKTVKYEIDGMSLEDDGADRGY